MTTLATAEAGALAGLGKIMDEKIMHQNFNKWWSSNRMRLGGYLLKDQAWIGWVAGWQQASQLTKQFKRTEQPSQSDQSLESAA